jgi:hypothetical protein
MLPIVVMWSQLVLQLCMLYYPPPNAYEKPGMAKAIAILRAPIKPYVPTRDVILHGVLSPSIEKNYHKMHALSMRLGHAWEWVLTDYGYEKLTDTRHIIEIKNQSGAMDSREMVQLPTPDLVNHRKKIILELKNGYHVNYIVQKQNILALKNYVRGHPGYKPIMGFINYKNDAGKVQHKDGVELMYGNRFLNFVFRPREKTMIINKLRNAIHYRCDFDFLRDFVIPHSIPT